MPVVIVLLVLIILAELFLLMLRCRREHPGWKLLRQYPLRPPGLPRQAPYSGKLHGGLPPCPLNTATALSWTSI